MARITVSDCIKDRFKLVVIAAQRARNIASGAEISVSRDRDKDPVIALREIAVNHVNIDSLEAEIIKRLQKNSISEHVADDANETNELINEELELSPEGDGWYVDENNADSGDFNESSFEDETVEGDDFKQ